MIIHPKDVIEQRLAAGFGLEQYEYIINQIYKVDISIDIDFQKTFNGFYRIRRDIVWRQHY